MPTAYNIYEVQIQNLNTGDSLITAGGAVHVATAGSPDKATIYDPDTLLTASNPLTPVRGKIRFATLATVGVVDLYGMDAAGRFFVRQGVRPGAVTEIYPDDSLLQMAAIPFSIANAAANVEQDTGFDLPAQSAVLPTPLVRVTTLEATRTINVGLLSSGTGGDADGFIAGASLAAAGVVVPALATVLGLLLYENFATTPAVRVPKPHPLTGTNTRRITYTLSASTAAAKGFALLPYLRAAPAA